MKLNTAEACGWVCSACEAGLENCGCGSQCSAKECCEKVWREQMEREEIDAVVRENGIRFAINQHICED